MTEPHYRFLSALEEFDQATTDKDQKQALERAQAAYAAALLSYGVRP